MFEARIRSLRWGRRWRKGGKLKEHNPALLYKEFEATLSDTGTVQMQPALVLWATTALIQPWYLEQHYCFGQSECLRDQSIYLRPNAHRLPESFTGHTVWTLVQWAACHVILPSTFWFCFHILYHFFPLCWYGHSINTWSKKLHLPWPFLIFSTINSGNNKKKRLLCTPKTKVVSTQYKWALCR